MGTPEAEGRTEGGKTRRIKGGDEAQRPGISTYLTSGGVGKIPKTERRVSITRDPRVEKGEARTSEEATGTGKT